MESSVGLLELGRLLHAVVHVVGFIRGVRVIEDKELQLHHVFEVYLHLFLFGEEMRNLLLLNV